MDGSVLERCLKVVCTPTSFDRLDNTSLVSMHACVQATRPANQQVFSHGRVATACIGKTETTKPHDICSFTVMHLDVTSVPGTTLAKQRSNQQLTQPNAAQSGSMLNACCCETKPTTSFCTMHTDCEALHSQ